MVGTQGNGVCPGNLSLRQCVRLEPRYSSKDSPAMGDLARDSTDPPRRFQFSIRTLLEATAVVACLCAAWASYEQRPAIAGKRLIDRLSLPDLVSKAAGTSQTIAQRGSHSRGADTDYWIMTIPLKSLTTEEFLENLHGTVTSRLSELGVDVKQSPHFGWGAYLRDNARPCGPRHQVIMYRLGVLRGVLVMDVVDQPTSDLVYLLIKNVQFR